MDDLSKTKDAVINALTPRFIEGANGAQFLSPVNCETPAQDINATTHMGVTQTGPQQNFNCPPQWWNLEVFAWNLQADTANPPVARQATPRWSDIITSPSRGSGVARLLVSTGGDRIRLDIQHGNRYSFFTDNLLVELELPRGAINIGEGSPGGEANGVRDAPIDRRLNNIAVMVNLHSSVSPMGQRLGQLTTTNFVTGAAGDVRVLIPDRAVRVQFFDNTPGGPPGPIIFECNDFLPTGVSAAPADIVGTVDFPAGSAQFTPIIKIPGNATVVNLGAAIRNVTAVWCLEI